MSSTVSTFNAFEIGAALVWAAMVQTGFVGLLILAGAADAQIRATEEETPQEEPIAVKPILDDEVPLMKLGGKKKVRAKLPEMWKKQAAVPVPEENLSAPSPEAKDEVKDIPDSAVATGDAAPTPADAKVPDAQLISDAAPQTDAAGNPDETEKVGEGDPNGVENGTTTDPLQANWKRTYHAKILSRFNARFSPPVGQVPCEELKNLTSVVSATVSPDRTVTGFSVGKPSGNGSFDSRVQSAMSGMVGQQLPPPPPLCTDCQVPSTVTVTFTGRTPQCK